MYNTVFGVMNDHKEVWTGVFQLRNVFEKFTENTVRLTKLKTEQEKDLQSFFNTMTEKRETLIILCTPIINIILAYAHDQKEKELLKKLNLNKNKLAISNDSDLIEKCKTIYKAAKKLYKKSSIEVENSDNKKVGIKDYGLDEKMIIDLEVAVKDFGKSRLALHEAIQAKDKMGKQIATIIKKNKKLLENKMDLLISIFEKSSPDFYKSYVDARIIQIVESEKVKSKKEKKIEKREQAKESLAE